jgi:hypothetical protein
MGRHNFYVLFPDLRNHGADSMTKLLIDRAVVEQLTDELASRCGTNADEWPLINRVRAALAQTEQPAQGLNLLWKATHPDKLIEPAQGEQLDFNAFYDTVCNRPISIREIAKRCWSAALLQSKPAEPVNKVMLDALIAVEALFGHLAKDSTQKIWLDKARAAIAQAQPAKREPLSDEQFVKRMSRMCRNCGTAWWEHTDIECPNGTSNFQEAEITKEKSLPDFSAIEAEITKGQQ